MKSKLYLAIICTFLWIGFVGAISFMEAWLKFCAPGITLPLGLGIGRLVFNALNKMEWLFACVFWQQSYITGKFDIGRSNGISFCPSFYYWYILFGYYPL